MARKLKTYQTSLGFFDLAIAAPSMKAALEAWGADSNLFHQGAAKESDDPDVIAATMAKPGIVLRRPVGSDGSFGEHAHLPTNLGNTDSPKKVARKSQDRQPKKSPSRPVDKLAERKAALAFEKEQKRRERERPRRRPPDRSSVIAGSRRSTRHRRRWTRPSGNIRRRPRRSTPRSRRSSKDRELKTPVGIGRRSNWAPRCGAHGARVALER